MKKLQIAGEEIAPGETRDLQLKVSERPTGEPVRLPLRVVRGKAPGPTVAVVAGVHGDEMNGIGIVHELMFGDHLKLNAGCLVLVPVVNILGFESQTRYVPDRRDLNRCFPGSARGSLSSRMANAFFDGIVRQCDYCIDLHSAASPRTNFPNVRGDRKNRQVSRIARFFGCELMVNSPGPEGSLRRVATEEGGCAAIILEAGEPGKIEPAVVDVGVRGVCNVLVGLDLQTGRLHKPSYQTWVDKATWVRAQTGGILRYHVTPGQVVAEGDPLATNVSVFGCEQNVLNSPVDGVVLGMTTSPAVHPGEPVCHIAIPRSSMRTIRRALKLASAGSLHQRARADLATGFVVSEREAEVAIQAISDDDAKAPTKPRRRGKRATRQQGGRE